jgi:hypothetical protein
VFFVRFFAAFVAYVAQLTGIFLLGSVKRDPATRIL